jgi:thiol-disulfide isomerase/thioredoxin
MTSLGLAALVHLAVLTAGDESYATAHKATCETGRPMVVMVGADWCPACQQMKENVIPQCRKQGILAKVVFALVNLDRERELGAELTQGGPIPQLLLFRRVDKGWRVKRLIGGQDVQTVDDFIKDGIKADETSKQVKSADKPPVPEQKANAPKTAAVEHGKVAAR